MARVAPRAWRGSSRSGCCAQGGRRRRLVGLWLTVRHVDSRVARSPAGCDTRLMNLPHLSMDEFVAIAQRVIAELDEPFKQWLVNVVVDVELEPTRRILREVGLDPRQDTLLGLFVGRAVTEQEYGEHAPNQILLFKRPIEEACRSRQEVAYEIRRTLI